ncbi:hypothetical protein LCGC14_2230750, partial [marine sediment metagenome]
VSLTKYGKELQTVELDEGATVSDVLDKFKIPENIPKLRIVNNVHVSPDHILKDGDVLALFPPIAGG